jgi:hypothetical protein
VNAADGPPRIVCVECHMVTKLSAAGVADLLPDYGMIRLLNANGASARTAVLCTACTGSEKYAQVRMAEDQVGNIWEKSFSPEMAGKVAGFTMEMKN